MNEDVKQDTAQPAAAAGPGPLAKALEEAEEIARMKRIEGKLGLPGGYYNAMVDTGSDWDFAIKLVVLVEAALGRVIAAHLNNQAVTGHCERLSLDGRAGKLTLAQDLDLLRADEARAVSAMAFVRNRFAHRVESIEGNLTDYAQGLPAQELHRLVKHLLMVPKDLEQQVHFLWTNEHTTSLFRHIMWTSGSMVLDVLARHDMKAEAEAARRERIEQSWMLSQGGLAGLFQSQAGQTKLADLLTLGAETPLALRDAAARK